MSVISPPRASDGVRCTMADGNATATRNSRVGRHQVHIAVAASKDAIDLITARACAPVITSGSGRMGIRQSLWWRSFRDPTGKTLLTRTGHYQFITPILGRVGSGSGLFWAGATEASTEGDDLNTFIAWLSLGMCACLIPTSRLIISVVSGLAVTPAISKK